MSAIRLVRPPSGHTLNINKKTGGELDVKVQDDGLIKYDLYSKKPEKFVDISVETKIGGKVSPYPYYLDMHRAIAKKYSVTNEIISYPLIQTEVFQLFL